ncbi:YkgJ family cysteine cluster protein [Megalodesulfovibrio paquesii]
MPNASDSAISPARFTRDTVCTRCAGHGATCCRLDPGGSGLCFPVSVMEWERILDVVGGMRGAFVQEPNTAPFVDALRRLFPGEGRVVEGLFPPHKFHLRLATTASGDCVFLGSRGCALPTEARPYYCRLFPFWMQGERITMLQATGCQALREGGTREEVMALLHMRESEVRTLHGRLRLAWGLPPKPGQPVPPPSFARTRPQS